MDIAFHYFAVKVLARAAGYEEEKAQRIATYSQFIDDFNYYTYRVCGNIPDYLYDKKLDIIVNKTFKIINPVTTGFSDAIDMALLATTRSQKFTVSPFHFIPMSAELLEQDIRYTVPATLRDGSFISTILDELKMQILSRQDGITDDDLMHMGMLFHTFADTYAHQLFSGYWDDQNSVILKSVYNEASETDETEKYFGFIEKLIKVFKDKEKTVPSVGHMMIMHIPDLTHLRFVMDYTQNQKTYTYSRSNTMEFIRAAKSLYEFLCSCLPNSQHMDWEELSAKLATGFLFDASKELDSGEEAVVSKLKPHWERIFPNVQFSYSSKAIKRGFGLSKTAVLMKNGKEIASVVIDDENNYDGAVAQLFQVTDGISNDRLRIALKNALNHADNRELENETALNGSQFVDATIDGVGDIFIYPNYTEDFYKFNYFADLLLIHLYGNHPRVPIFG